MIDQTFHYTFLGILILLLISIFVLFIWYYSKRVAKLKQIYNSQALKRNGVVSEGFLAGYPKLKFNYNSNNVRLYTTLRGRYSPPHTNFEITFYPPISQKMVIYKEGYASKIGKAIGMHDIQIGTDFFDKEVIIKGSDEYFIRSLLTYDLQEKILLIIEKLKGRIFLNKEKLEISFTDILTDEFLCDELINLGLRLVEKIKEKGSLY